MPLNVIHVMWSLEMGGAESVTLDLVRRSDGSSLKTSIVCVGGRAGVLENKFRELGCDVEALDLKRRPLTALKRLSTVIRLHSPAVVFIHIGLPSSLLAVIASASGARRIVIRTHSDGDGRGDALTRRAYRGILRILAQVTPRTELISVSPSALEFASSLVSRWHPRGRVIPNFVDTDVFRCPVRGTPQDIDVLYVGRSDAAKRRWLLPPIADSLGVFGIGPLVVCGVDGSDLEGSRSNLQCLGLRRDVPELLRRARCLILVSEREGLPGVILEAVSSGVPVISTNTTGASYIAERVMGVQLVDTDTSPDEWAETIFRLLSVSSRNASAEIADSVRDSEFAVDNVMRAWSDVLTDRDT